MNMKYPSPDDIAEMKRRGYDRSVVERAIELSGRWHDAESVRDQIRKAFAGVRLGLGVGLYEAQAIDNYASSKEDQARLREKDEKEDWRNISIESLNECNSSLSFLDAEGMRFHIPAYLIADLNGDYRFGLAFSLVNPLGIEAQFKLLSESQRSAVRRYLEYIAQEKHYAFDREAIVQALSGYWAV